MVKVAGSSPALLLFYCMIKENVMDGSSYGRNFARGFWMIIGIVAAMALAIGFGISFAGSSLGWW